MITVFPSTEGGEAFAQRTRRRPAVARACAECQRRKVKCDGQLPCYSCRVGQVSCRFPERRRRIEQQQRRDGAGDVKDYEAVVRRLFGQTSIAEFKDYSRDKLVALLEGADSAIRCSPVSPTTAATPSTSVSSKVSDAIQRLQKLEDGPSEGFEWDESDLNLQEAAADDVNALSLPAQPRSSFLGIFSIATVVRVLVNILPRTKMLYPTSNDAHPAKTDQGSMTPLSAVSPRPAHPASQIPYHESQRLIDAYFSEVHVFSPMVHEPTFRMQFLTQSRKDSAWLALFYMVLALGSVASSTSDSDQDIVYYREAQAHLGLESFGSGHLETLQALILMGGMYLHYRNRPNMASAIIGAANRMACGLGLHRESHGSVTQRVTDTEIKRRTWWSCYVLDSWGSITLGRPNYTTKHDTKQPRNLVDDQNGEAAANEPTLHSPLIHNITLCKMLGHIQSRLQISPILDPREIASFDKMLVEWFERLPLFMRFPHPCSLRLRVVRSVFNWRYQNIRILLHRAVALDATIRQISFSKLGDEEQNVVAQCRQLAAESILCIKSEWQPTKMSGWNGVWFLFQACLIPLMALATEPPDENGKYLEWTQQVEIGIALCRDMSPWSLVGEKTRVVLEQLLKATQRPGLDAQHTSGGDEGIGAIPRDLNPLSFYREWCDVMGEDDTLAGFDQALFDDVTELM